MPKDGAGVPGQFGTGYSVPPTGPGWRPWGYGGSPDDYVEVEVWRPGGLGTTLLDSTKLSPMANVYGWYWCPAGPLREGKRR